MEQFVLNLKKYVEKNGTAKLQKYEDSIFSEKIDRKTRASMELKRIENELNSKPEIYIEYYDNIKHLGDLLKVADFDSTVLDQIYSDILLMQMSCGQQIRLYSGLALILDELSNENTFRKDR